MRLLKSTGICALTLSFGITACGGDGDGDKDTGMSGGMDAGIVDRGNLTRDVGFLDTGPRPDATPTDAGHYCAMGNNVTVDGTAVAVGSATESPGAAAILSCIDAPLPILRDGRITLRSCMNFANGTTGTANELADLEIAVFPATQLAGGAIDPTFDAVTGLDRAPNDRLDVDVVLQPNSVACPSGVEFEIGRNSQNDFYRASVEYTIRMRSKTSTTGAGIWATAYFDRQIVLPDRVEGAGGSISNCTPQDCTGSIDLVAVRRATVSAFIAASGANVAGATNLDDNVGDGFAMITAEDCQRTPLANVVAGFAPAPAASGYIVGGAFTAAATDTDATGLFVGLGFSGTSSTAALPVKAAVGVLRDLGACTEEFSGDEIPIYPDSITVYRSGRLTTLHQ